MAISKYLNRPLTFGNLLRVFLWLLIFTAPFARGLFVEAYLFPYIMAVSILFILSLIDQFLIKDTRFFNHPLDYAMLALFLATLLSLIKAVDLRAAVIGLMVIAACVMIYWLCYLTSQKSNDFNGLMYAVYVSGVCMTIVALLIYSGVIHYEYLATGQRVAGLLEYSNTFGIYAAVISIVGWGLIMVAPNQLLRTIISSSNALLIMAMFGSLSRGTWVLYPFAVLGMIFLTSRGNRLNSTVIWLGYFIPGLIAGRLFISHYLDWGGVIYIIMAIVMAVFLHTGLAFIIEWAEKKETSVGRKGLLQAAGVLLALLVISTFFLKGNNDSYSQGDLSRFTNITLQDTNVQARLEFDRDAFRIVKTHPVIGVGSGGWAALYHQYASRLYWTEKAHNYFLQTWLESGTIGFIALLSIWFVLINKLWKYYKDSRSKDYLHRETNLFWSCAVACFLLAAHSIIDFDMSYLALMFLLFGFIGALKGQMLDSQDPNTLAISIKPSKKRRHKQSKTLQWSPRVIAPLGVGIAAFALLVVSVCYWSAGRDYNQAQSLINKDPNQAMSLFNDAIKCDPLNAIYYCQAANIWASDAVSNQNQDAYKQALNNCAKAERLAPYNIRVMDNINQVYSMLGEYERGVALAHAIIRCNPWDPNTYENLASNQLFLALKELESGNLVKARNSWMEIPQIKYQVPLTIGDPPVGLDCISGIAYLLNNEKATGRQMLQHMLTIELDPNRRLDRVIYYQVQARLWLAASLERDGYSNEAQNLLNQLPDPDKAGSRNNVDRIKSWLHKANAIKH